MVINVGLGMGMDQRLMEMERDGKLMGMGMDRRKD
jgi:hypothetical protein